MTSAFTAKLHLPLQDLDAPSLFAPTADAVKKWLETLPKTNLGQTTRFLYNALTELNRVRLKPSLRAQLLDALRPAIYFAGEGLRRHYLNQPLQLAEQPLKVTRLAHVLREQLAIGYTLTAVQLTALGQGNGLGPTQLNLAVATALHRALTEHSRNLLRDLLLYRTPHPGCWLTLHQLCKFARDCNLLGSVVADPQAGASSIEHAYLRALLIGSARTNQLRQENIDSVFARALGWASATNLDEIERSALAINDNNDDGPIYCEYVDASSAPGWRGFNTAQLVRELTQQREAAEAEVPDDPQLPPELLAHLIQAWSSPGTREFLRTPASDQVEISVGLTATHHFAAGGADFQLLLGHGHQRLALKDENPFLKSRTSAPLKQTTPRDVWNSPYAPRAGALNVSLEIIEYKTREEHQRASAAKGHEKFRSEAANRVNISPGGLCITWPPHSKVLLRTGEIVGVHESALKSWSIGVIRWKQLSEGGPRLGIELLSPNGLPYGARPINKTGPQGDYQRVLILPEIKQIGQPTTLIAPRLPFRVGQKVSLMNHGNETRVQLTRKFASTASFNQFEFRRLSTASQEIKPDPAAADKSDGGFDILWDSL
jgi:hypothetical protein